MRPHERAGARCACRAGGARPLDDPCGVVAAQARRAGRRSRARRRAASGRSRSPTAAATTVAIRASPFTPRVARPRASQRDASCGFRPRDRGELHVLLAERRQHLLDVAQEHRARPDEQHALRARAGAGACRAGTRRGAARPAVLPVPGPPADDEHARQRRRGSPRPARPGSSRRCRPCDRCGCARARRGSAPSPPR